MKGEDYTKINKLLESSSRGLDGNTTAYINGMLKEAQKELLSELRSIVILDQRNCQQDSLLHWIKSKESKN